MKKNYQYLEYPIGILPILEGSDAKVLLAYLLNTSNYFELRKHRDDFEVSIETLSKLMQVSTNTLYKALKQLTLLGIISRTSNGYGNGKQTATYSINWEKIGEYDKLEGGKKIALRKWMLEKLKEPKSSTPIPQETKPVVPVKEVESEEVDDDLDDYDLPF